MQMGGGQLTVIEMIVQGVKKKCHGMGCPGKTILFRSQRQSAGIMPFYPVKDRPGRGRIVPKIIKNREKRRLEMLHAEYHRIRMG